MILITLFITILCMINARIKFKNWHNPYFVFNALWFCVTGLIIIGNYYIYEPSPVAIKCVFIGVIGYNLSILMPTFVIGKKTNNISEKNEFTLNTKVVIALSFFVLLFSIINAASSIKSFMDGNSFSEIRENYYTYASSGSIIMYYFGSYLLSPMRYVVILSAIISIFKKKKESKILLSNMVIIVILQSLTSGGRYVLMNTVFMFICGFFLFKSDRKMPFKRKLLFIGLVIIFSYFIIFLTNERATYRSMGMTTFQRAYLTIYEYFVGSVTYLGKVLEKYPFLPGSTYGLNFAAGFITPIFAMATFLNILSYPAKFNIIGIYACDVLKIGIYTFYNAMPTAFGYFYIDGGLIFTLLESLLFGYICKKIYLRALGGNLLFAAIYILLFVQICNMSTRWFFYSSDYCLAFLYIRFFMRKFTKENKTLDCNNIR
ncbi:oligosaccharide repeat unit polymerase [Clostridium perfringens]|uniref:O-antigen polymerase n=1 Tax=Clostridium perfringens TaxID=1502 RepID=UPI0018D9DE55|nr:O-antigen polymerase [Clostridium perfringens]QPS26181.1 oligosaccharide repeat unit polymerase [Clostridium perfringens]